MAAGAKPRGHAIFRRRAEKIMGEPARISIAIFHPREPAAGEDRFKACAPGPAGTIGIELRFAVVDTPTAVDVTADAITQMLHDHATGHIGQGVGAEIASGAQAQAAVPAATHYCHIGTRAQGLGSVGAGNAAHVVVGIGAPEVHFPAQQPAMPAHALTDEGTGVSGGAVEVCRARLRFWREHRLG